LNRALGAVADAVLAGERDPQRALEAGHSVLRAEDIQADYLELVDAGTLAPVSEATGELLALVAATVGHTRLIDNQPIHALSLDPRRDALVAAGGVLSHGRP
jgi:pantothenate synthetase